jgi:hypothetical protein
MKLPVKAFTASPTGAVKLTVRLSRAHLAALKRVRRLRFTVTAALGARTFTTKLTLHAPRTSAARA